MARSCLMLANTACQVYGSAFSIATLFTFVDAILAFNQKAHEELQVVPHVNRTTSKYCRIHAIRMKKSSCLREILKLAYRRIPSDFS